MPLDKSDMHGLILKFPQQCRDAMHLSKGMLLPKTIKSVIACGMGGSAIAGDILCAYMKNSSLPVTVVRDYQLPPWIDEETLVIGMSYSGNTEETLSCVDQALSHHSVVLGITSGGKLKEKLDRVIVIPAAEEYSAKTGLYLSYGGQKFLNPYQKLIILHPLT